MTLGLKSLDHYGFLVWQHISLDVIKAQLARDRLGCRWVVAGQHNQANTFRVEELNGLRRRGLDWIGYANQTSRSALDGDEHHGLTLLPKLLGAFDKGLWVNRKFFEQLGAADGYRAALNCARDAFAGDRTETVRLGELEAAFLGSSDNGASQRMFARLFKAGEQAQHFQVLTAFCGLPSDQLGLAFRQGARFVDHKSVDPLQCFQGFRVPNQNTGLCASPP